MNRSARARRALAVVGGSIAVVGLVISAVLPAGATSTPTATPTATPTSTGATATSTAPATATSTPTAPAPPALPTSSADAWATQPYMGWSSYSMQVYSGNSQWITGSQIIKESDAMHAKLQKYGYDYINIDAGWADGVDANGRPTPSTKLYPQGFQAIIDHVHANGQKIGVYMIPGISPAVYQAALPIAGAPGCTTHDIVAQPTTPSDYWHIGYKIDFSNPCSQKYIDSIVDLFAKWGVNFVKFDSVTPGSGVSDLSLDARDDVAAWSKALKAHKIWFELSWALDPKYADYWHSKANGWRVEWDVECYCAKDALTKWDNISRLFPDAATWWRNAGDGGWNDFDSLDVGNGEMDGLTRDERQTATTLWAISAAPMYTGNDLTKLDSYGLSLLTNPEVVAVDQAGTPARPVSISTQQQTWYSLNSDGSYTVALFNLGQTEKDVTANWSDIGLKGAASVRDLWSHKNLGSFSGKFTAKDVPIHGVRLLKVTPRTGDEVSVNDDALRVGYTGDWTRNGGSEVAATSQPLTVNVTDTGTPTPPSGSGSTLTTKVDDGDSGIVYTGSWSQSTGRGLGDYDDNVHYTQTDGDSFQYTFTGTGVSYVTEEDTSQGQNDVYIDGNLVKTVDTGRADGQPRLVQQAVYTATGLTNGSHTIKVVKKSGGYMLLDRIDVTQQGLLDPASVSFDKKAPADGAVKLLRDPAELAGIQDGSTTLVKGTDYTLSGSTVTLTSTYLATLPVGAATLTFEFTGDYLDDVHVTTHNGDAVSYVFSGTGVKWITATGPDQGSVDIYIDGKFVKSVDTASDVRRTEQTVFSISGLRNGKHTFQAVKRSGDILRSDVIRYTV
ncbi:MAG: alpha-galactosidase [Actinomycetota bacterium]|nr:alpha-galactosidase [Actinomycetota bacterium]